MQNPNDFSVILWVLLLPLIGSLLQALIGKRVIDSMGVANGRRTMGILAVLPIAAAFAIGLTLTLKLSGMDPETRLIRLTFSEWISLQSIRIPFEIQVDTLSMTMVLIITGIGALIHLYATGYMGEEKEYSRFFTYMNLFIGFMLILVLGGNLAMTFIGWEGVGLCSYLLIGFWYTDNNNAKAANKAFIVNRIGDWGFTLGLFLIVAVLVGNWDKLAMKSDRLISYDVIAANMTSIGGNTAMMTAIALLLFVGACGKSAQFPLYLWLPDAMAGPTPVSALIHAATMVTSGVFLLNRMHLFFEASPAASAIVAIVGAFTACFAALIAFGQTDIKKVLAYSTVSQLGYMFVACGSGVYWAGMFHVATHAFFKALLFLGSGAVIHAMAHNQDMRNYGNLRKYLKITFVCMFIATLAISGVPGFAGFYSKEAILNGALVDNPAVLQTTINGRIIPWDLGNYAGWIGLFTAMLTAWYMMRMTMLTFFGGEERWRQIPAHAESHANGHDHGHAHDHANGGDHDENHHHGEDVHGFFYTDEEMTARVAAEEHPHHHELDETHQPKEVPITMWLPLVLLAIPSVVAGYLMERDDVFKLWLYPHLNQKEVTEFNTGKFAPFSMTLGQLSLMAAGVGIFCGVILYVRGLPNKEGWDLRKWSRFRRAAQNQFGYDQAMMSAAVEGGNDVGGFFWKGIDGGVIDRIVNGSAWLTSQVGSQLRRVQTGFIRGYALMMLCGGLALLWYAAVHLGGQR